MAVQITYPRSEARTRGFQNQVAIRGSGWSERGVSRRLLTGITLSCFFLLLSFSTFAQTIPQRFIQEKAGHRVWTEGLPSGRVQLLEIGLENEVRVFMKGRWWLKHPGSDNWVEAEGMTAGRGRFRFWDGAGRPVTVSLDPGDILQILRQGDSDWLITAADPYVVRQGTMQSVGWPSRWQIHQAALSPDGRLHVASAAGLMVQSDRGWSPLTMTEPLGRAWGAKDVLGVLFDQQGRLWFASKAGVGVRQPEGWQFFEGRDGLPWNDFTGLYLGRAPTMNSNDQPGRAVPVAEEIWMTTRLGVIRWDGNEFHYRQGPRWLPDDAVHQVAVDVEGHAWLATDNGLGVLIRAPMTLAEKAFHYETEIDKYIRRTQFGYVAEAALKEVGKRESADPQDSDNDGLWTAMYGAGQCFGYAATGDSKNLKRAQQAFEALRFLQKITQGGSQAPPKGYIARTIRSTELPDPNIGGVEADRRRRETEDRLWKVYEPRWPRSEDGRWYWKSDTSSDELDGHYFFYPLYYEFCATTEDERERVREVVRDLTDHLITYRYVLMEHDGTPTRWAVFGPEHLNHDPNWWPERGLNSLSLLSYLAVAHHITGDMRYAEASRELIDVHAYAHNAMFPKVQHGPGSGNQSDDEMAVMCFYNLLRYSKDEDLKKLIQFSFFRYWVNEAPEMNPFFNFAYAASNQDAMTSNPWGDFSLNPWAGWLEDSQATLYGFPLDRLNWPHRNSHRLDIVFLSPQQSMDIYEPQRGTRGHRVDGRVLPVENRYFTHWNTDPWRLDYGGAGNELGAGTVFLLPYYMGMLHGFVERP